MKEIILMYLPTALMAVATVLNFTKITSTLKNVFKGTEIKQLKKELELIKTELKEQIQVNKQLINTIGKVQLYDKNENTKI